MEEARGDGPEDGPVNHVTWLDAVRFCNRWSELDGLTPCYAVDGAVVREPPDGDGYRLPTEAEWAYACRAGTDSAWSFGDDEGAIDDHAWSEGNGGRRTHPVAERRPNPSGLYDLHGNVWEWRGDAPVSHPNTGEEEVQDPFKVEVLDVQGNSWRCARGGSASSRPRETRSSHRGRAFPEDMGFRCVWVSAREHSG